jgi:hypothetical protein
MSNGIAPVNTDTLEQLVSTTPNPERIFSFTEGTFKKKTYQLPLDQLRLFCIIIPGSSKWRLVSTSQELDVYFPDLMSQDNADALYELLDELTSTEKPYDPSTSMFCLADYEDQGIVIRPNKLTESSRMALLSGLYEFRNERRERLKQWLSKNPDVTLKGGLGSKAILNRNGYHLKNKDLPWSKVKKITTQTTGSLLSTTHMFVLTEGHSGGMFDFHMGDYALARISTKKKELYIAECNFWRTYCGV